ncbi:MAG: hypothetical protein K2Z81_20825, partial [Cyanobacteria bacterium]|nr:hypothetical protein [Cyanobacteriota bacterium]
QIHAIKGVLKTITRQYEINIHIAASFNWEEVHEQIIRILRNVYFGGGEVEIESPFYMPAFWPLRTFDQVFGDEQGKQPEYVVGTSICPYCVLVEGAKTPKASLLNTGNILCLECNRICPGPVTLDLLDYFGTTPWFRRMIGILTSQLTGNRHFGSEPAFRLAKKGGQNYEYWLRRTTDTAEELLFITLRHYEGDAAAPKQRWEREADSLSLKLWHLEFEEDKGEPEEQNHRVDDATFKRSWTRTDPVGKTETRVYLYQRRLEKAS